MDTQDLEKLSSLLSQYDSTIRFMRMNNAKVDRAIDTLQASILKLRNQRAPGKYGDDAKTDTIST